MTQSTAHKLLFTLKNILEGIDTHDGQCWGCDHPIASPNHPSASTLPDGAILCMRIFAEEAIKEAEAEPDKLPQQLKLAAASFAAMSETAEECSREVFIAEYRPILLPMFRGLIQIMEMSQELSQPPTQVQ